MRSSLWVTVSVFLFISCTHLENERDEMPPLGGMSADSLYRSDFKYLQPTVNSGSASADEYFKFAEAAYYIKKMPDAEAAIKQGIALKPNQPDYYFLQSRIFLAQDKKKKAIDAAENAAGRKFENPEFYAYMADLYLTVDSLRLAEEYIRESLILAPGWVPSLQSQSELMLRKGLVYESQKLLAQAQRIDPGNARTYDLLVKGYLQLPGRLDSAYRMNKRALIITGQNHEGILHNEAKIMERLGHVDSALHIYQQIAKTPHKEPVYAQMAEIYLKNGGYSKGYALLSKQIEETPEKKWYYFRAGYCLEQLGKYNAAHALYVKGQSRFPDDNNFKYAVSRTAAKIEIKYRYIE